MNKLLSLLKPWQWLTLAFAGCLLALAAFLGDESFNHEYIKGLTKAIWTAPPEAAKAREAVHGVGKPLRTAAYEIRDGKNRKGEPQYKTAIDASLCRAKWCKEDLKGSNIRPGCDNEDIAACLTAHLRDRFGSEDYELDSPCEKEPGKSWREFWFEELIRMADACEKA